MNGERKSCTERILNAIEYGELSNVETERRLCELVEAEINKTDSEADMELIKACQSLMWQLHTHGDIPYDSHYDANAAKIDHRLRRNVLIANTAKSIGKMLAVAAAVILLLVGARFSWFEHSDTLDGQQHVITGHEITVEMVQTAIAENAGRGLVETTDLNKLQEMIGFDPHIPETIADKWHVSMCRVWFSRNSVQVTVEYQNIQGIDEPIKYIVNYYTDANDSYLTFEQSDMGKDIMLSDQVVYLSMNIDNYVACWNENNTVYEINCGTSERIFMEVLQTIIGGET